MPNEPHAEVSVTIVDLSLSASTIEHVEAAATPREHRRVSTFATADLGLRWLAAQHAAKQSIARRHEVSASLIELRSEEAGRPLVEGADCQFSMSKTGRWAAIAIAETHIGVDIELGKPLPEAASLATRFLHANDAAQILDADDPQATFYRAWVRLEAVVKRLGSGFDESSPPEVLGVATADLWDLDLSDVDLGDVASDVRLFGAISVDRSSIEQGLHHREIAAGDEVLPLLIRVQTIDEVLGLVG